MQSVFLISLAKSTAAAEWITAVKSEKEYVSEKTMGCMKEVQDVGMTLCTASE